MGRTRWDPIVKSRLRGGLPPRMPDHAAACLAFDWKTSASELLSGGGAAVANIAHLAVDRHATGPRADHVAIRWRSKTNESRAISYRELAQQTARFANALGAIGVEAGDAVFSLLGRVPELYVTAIGALKRRAVFCPMFSVFGPGPIQERMVRGRGVALVTTARLYERRIEGIRSALPDLRHVLLIDVPDDALCPRGTRSLPALLASASPSFEIPATSPEDPALLHFTSGTTGTPKGALHVHRAALAHYVTGAYALDMHPEDVYWCTSDPGWVTGTSYGIVAPLLHGLTQIVDEGEFDAERWYRTLQDERVTIWYTAPTALRRLMRAGEELPKKFDLGALRFVASVGEPLNPEVVVWGERALGIAIHDNWWQTETGGIMIANYASMDIRPGSMGKPLPGIETALVRRRGDDELEIVETPDTEGELAIRRGWPSMFRAYLGAPDRYAQCFRGDFYLSGDLMTRDADGYYWFVGRADDVIKSAGHLVGPFEVENALMEHPAVAEVGVVGMPDPIAGEFVKAFVCLHRDRIPDEALRRDLLAHARSRLGPAVAPREIEFVADLPRTRSGKLMRRLLKARELGLPEGDLSTLEPPEEGR